MITKAAEANNDSINIKWSFKVVLDGSCFLIFQYFLGEISVAGLSLHSCRQPCLQLYLDSGSVLVFS